MLRSSLVGLLFLIAFTANAATPDDARCGVFDLYDRLLPVLAGTNDEAGTTEVVIVRYIPGDTSVDREFRFKLYVSKAGTLRATWQRPERISLLQQVRELESKGIVTCDDVTKNVSLRATEVTDQRLLRSILAQLHSLQVPARLESAIYLDVPQYTVVERAGMNAATYVLYGPTIQSAMPHPLIKWCRTLPQRLDALDTKK